eukprot:COSAG01_NODE_33918_length_556_cov_1.330416_1_plen_63_part_00
MEPCAKKMHLTSIDFTTLGVLGNEEGVTLMEMIMEFLENHESLFYAALTCNSVSYASMKCEV